MIASRSFYVVAHADTLWMEVASEAGQGLLVTRAQQTTEFSFNCAHFTAKQLTETPHDFELVPMDETVVNVDFMQSGIGSNSCGPELDPAYRLTDTAISFAYRLLPVRTGDVCPFEKAL